MFNALQIPSENVNITLLKKKGGTEMHINLK